ncbi:fumarylacetoacetate hydrolase family protein [Lutibaculum baratangense]|uniref:Fumarylacetoacetate hydrolase family protein n=1 Tax=Lutibaculum baratangense AMV1 TaxID=631454 RepID=V4RCB4_9HYPH|nr:fumarylacetoacetate hydrolase family protein [Lutibaculum baratangense]ESR23024.1 Fumarylacetoacetate hydrolase family protein [Lutibaculum baratangense AMV1]
MRLAAYRKNGQSRIGVVENGSLRDLGAFPRDSVEFGRLADEVAAGTLRPGAAVDGVREPAIPAAPDARIICIGLNYAEHAREGGREPPDYPAFFFRIDTSLAPNGARVPVPEVSDKLDYEAELLIVIGRGGRMIPEDKALEHVFGYGVFNDISLRDYQRKGGQWTPGKNFDGTGIVGDEIVTPDEVPSGATGLGVRAILNGKTMQDANTDDMIFTVARSIAIVSEFMTLRPGDLIATGTPSGVGYARTPPVWMKPGDEIVVEVDRVGRISSVIG